MNGRLYQSSGSYFYSPDPNIPDPENTLDYDRYAYVDDNPLTYADPSGFGPCDPGNSSFDNGLDDGGGGNDKIPDTEDASQIRPHRRGQCDDTPLVDPFNPQNPFDPTHDPGWAPQLQTVNVTGQKTPLSQPVLPPLTLQDIVFNSAAWSNPEAQQSNPQSGHHYSIKTSTFCSASDTFNSLKAPDVSAPGAPAAQEGTHELNLTGGNPILQTVNTPAMTIVNTTLPGHVFYPGTVTISVTPAPDGSVIQITGTGTGADPLFNDIVGNLFFGGTAALIQNGCALEAGAPYFGGD